MTLTPSQIEKMKPEDRELAETATQCPCPECKQFLRLLGEKVELEERVEDAARGRKHTQEWYARHYGKLHDWARKRLPENFRNEFFCCIANGTWGYDDIGENYICKAGFEIQPSAYVKFDTAQEQILHDQTTRAEAAEQRIASLEEQKARLEAALREIAEHPHKAYDDGQSGSYGLGIADGHRCAAKIAQAALAGLSPADRETPQGKGRQGK